MYNEGIYRWEILIAEAFCRHWCWNNMLHYLAPDRYQRQGSWFNRQNPQKIKTDWGLYCFGGCSMSDLTLSARRFTRADPSDSNSSSCKNSSISRLEWHSVETRDFRVTMELAWDEMIFAYSTSWKVKVALWTSGMEWYMNGSFVLRVFKAFLLKRHISISWWCSSLMVGTRTKRFDSVELIILVCFLMVTMRVRLQIVYLWGEKKRVLEKEEC